MIPDKIYLPKEEIEERKPWIETTYDPNWDECYIHKEALLKWLNDVENVYNKETDGNSVADGKYYIGMCEAFEMVANKLNSM